MKVKKIDLLGNIKLNNVSFKYTRNSNYVIKNISLSISKGSKIAIVGKSGSGKSTLNSRKESCKNRKKMMQTVFICIKFNIYSILPLQYGQL
ncbi:ATP-binding cassette domain-containing protein [Clostridium tagluense]|uniref:ATP-binding cassette domain-containing protein n=1 Tax=Clostridium tagluense TaxID=360422 RepID=UPI0021618B73|nr:ATP-binding cassette domain-containing protein [Clostridium tagluense]